MTPIHDKSLGYNALLAASEYMPDPDVLEIANRVREGTSMLWLEGADTLMVTTALGNTLYVSLLISKTAGAVSRNWLDLMDYMAFAGYRYLKCGPRAAAQERLYRWYGFERADDGFMVMDRLKQQAVH